MNTPSPYEEDLENAKKNLVRLQKTMNDKGIGRISIEYNGSGDSGTLEQVFIGDADQGEEVDPNSELWSHVEDAAFSVLTYNYPEWEINEGSKGEIDFELDERGKVSVKIRHAWMEYVEQDEIDGTPPDMREEIESSPSP